MKNIVIVLIATNKYRQFVAPLLEGIEKNFLKNHKVDVHLFTNELFSAPDIGRITVFQHIIPPYKFPQATLYRYKIFNDHNEDLASYDFIYYLDVDMEVALPVGEEIFGDITAVRHPGFFTEGRGWGSGNVHPQSTAYLSPEYWKKYYAGGFQGGSAKCYMEVCERLARHILVDEEAGILAEHNDESHFNHWLNKAMEEVHPEWKLTELDSSYCNVPRMEQRQMWGIDHLPAIIIALDKDHAAMRS